MVLILGWRIFSKPNHHSKRFWRLLLDKLQLCLKLTKLDPSLETFWQWVLHCMFCVLFLNCLHFQFFLFFHFLFLLFFFLFFIAYTSVVKTLMRRLVSSQLTNNSLITNGDWDVKTVTTNFLNSLWRILCCGYLKNKSTNFGSNETSMILWCKLKNLVLISWLTRARANNLENPQPIMFVIVVFVSGERKLKKRKKRENLLEVLLLSLEGTK